MEVEPERESELAPAAESSKVANGDGILTVTPNCNDDKGTPDQTADQTARLLPTSPESQPLNANQLLPPGMFFNFYLFAYCFMQTALSSLGIRVVLNRWFGIVIIFTAF